MSEDDGKTTLAVLGQQMKEMLRRQDNVDQKLDSVVDTVTEMSLIQAHCTAVQETRWEHHGEEHRALNQKKWAGDIGAAVAGIIAAAIAAVSRSP